MYRELKQLYCLFFLLVSGFFALQAQTLSVLSSVPIQNNTIALCANPTAALSVQASYSGASDSIRWVFQGTTPSSATGAGPFNLSYSAMGNYSMVVRVYSGGSIVSIRLITVEVGEPVTPTFSPSKTSFCQSDSIFTLDGFSPPGGYFRGPGIVGNTFNPDNIGTGNKTLWYVVKYGACADSVSTTVNVETAPNTQLSSTGNQVTFEGQLVHTICPPSPSVFNFISTTPASEYSSYNIDFGDGQFQTGSTFPAMVSHSYGTGIHEVVLTLTNSSGCSRTDTVRVFYGSNPAVGLNLSGNNEACIGADGGAVGYYFAVTGTGSNSPGTVYEVQFNDSTPPVTYQHPPPDSIFHLFTQGSCGYDATTYTNAFQAKIIAKNPCSSSAATVEPIFISEPAEPGFFMDPNACVNQSVIITDTSYSGSFVNGQNYANCGETSKVVWTITPNTYILNNGTFLGTRLHPTDPSQWFVGDNVLDITFTQAGTYTIKQVVGSVLACDIDSAINTICLDTIPTGNMSMSGDTVCIGDSITARFIGSLQSVCDMKDVRWRKLPGNDYVFGASTAFDTTQNYIFNRVGKYPITMVVENLCDSIEVIDTVVVSNVPSVRFPQDTALCGLGVVDFSQPYLMPQVHDSLSPVSYKWSVTPDTGWFYSVGDSTAAYPALEFTSYGTYQVQLEATNVCGSTADVMQVSLTPNPVIVPLKLDFKDTLICPGSHLSYKALVQSGTAPFQIEWGDSVGNVLSITDSLELNNITASLKLYVKVTDVLGCTDSTLFTISVLGAPSIDAGTYPAICYSDSIQLNPVIAGGTGPFTYRWSPHTALSDTTVLNPWRSPLDTSVTYTLRVTDSLGCTYFDSALVEVHPLPFFTAGNDFIVCLNQGDTTLSGASPAGGVWSGAGLSSNVFSPLTAGIGNHVLIYQYTDGNGCVFTDSVVASVIAQPKVGFTMSIDSACSPLTVLFTDTSLGGGLDHNWYMNGQLFSNQPNPQQTFVNLFADKDTVINIKLVFRAGSGCSDSAVKQIVVHPVPQANFVVPNIICAGDSLQLINASLFKSGAVSYSWSSVLGSLSSADTAQPWVSYSDSQNAPDLTDTIQLILTSVDGCVDTLQQPLIIKSRPAAGFILPAVSCAPFVVVPTDTSSGSGLSYQWSITPYTFVDTLGLNTDTPTFKFHSPTIDSLTYRIAQNIIDSNGCLDTTSQFYTIYAQPVAGFAKSATDSCSPFTVNFTDTSVTALSGVGETLTYLWDFGNGLTSTVSDTTVVFENTGVEDTIYYQTLIIWNSLGCSDTVIDSVIVHPNPWAQMQIIDSVRCAPFIVDTSAVKASLFPLANSMYAWQVLDLSGNIIQQFNGVDSISFALNSGSDSVYVRLISQSLYGCNNDTSALQLFYTLPNPIPAFGMSADSICSSELVLFSDSSSSGVSHEWYVNDSLFANVASPQLQVFNYFIQQDSTVSIKLITTNIASGCRDSISKSLVIHPQPVAGFTVPAFVCATDSIQPVNNSIDAVSYAWLATPGDLIFSDTTAAEPMVYFPDNQSGTPQLYQIQLIVNSVYGCSDTVEQSIQLNPRPLADFLAPVNACGPYSFQPISTSMGVSLNYQWEVSPATGVTLSGDTTSMPDFSFSSPVLDSLVYTIKLMVTDTAGCVDSVAKLFTIYPKPLAAFVPSNTDSCGPLTVVFQNASSSNLTAQGRNTMSFAWDFDNGQTSTDSTPTTTFTNTGVVDSLYIVQLIATNSLGCTDTVLDSIVVHPNPMALLDTTATLGCAPFLLDSAVVKAQIFTQANSNYSWEIYAFPSMSLLQTFTGPSGVSYWMNNPADSVLLRLITTGSFGCTPDTLEQIFTTIPNPEVGFELDTMQGCHPLTVNITDTSTSGLSYQWYINGKLQGSTAANPIFNLTNTSLTADSIYTIKMIGTSGTTSCSDSAFASVTVFAHPVADFMATEVCIGDSTQFISNSTSVDSLISFQWDFGDGNTSMSQNPTHLYADSGQYIVSLMVTDNRTCSSTIVDTVIVRPKPIADFISGQNCGADTACINKVFAFADASTVGALGGVISTWQWDVLNDGTTDYATQNPQHIFTQAGTFPVQLKVQSTYGCSDSTLKQIVVLDSIVPYFEIDTNIVCGPVNIVVSEQSSGPITTYQWTLFGESESGNRTLIFTTDQQDPTTVLPTLQPSYTNDTTYILVQTVSNCCDTISYETAIVLKPFPVGGLVALPPFGCSGFEVKFTLDGQTTGDPDSVVIDYGDGTVSTYYRDTIQWQNQRYRIFRQKTHNYFNTGIDDTTYIVTLTAYSECGDSTVQLPILVYPKLVQAAFTYNPFQGCEDLIVDFADQSFGGVTKVWSFDFDTVTGNLGQYIDTGDVATFTYTDPGNYVAALIVTDGCSYDTAWANISVFDAPEADFSYTNHICEGDTAFFNNLTQTSTGTITLVNWAFGDGDSSRQQSPFHVYDTAGTFNVWLKVNSTNGCPDSVSYPITIYPQPDVLFSAENVCAGEAVTFIDSSAIVSGSIVATQWKLDTLGTYFSNPSPFHFPNAGTYQVTLIKESNQGCIDSLTQSVEIYEVPRAAFSVKQDTTVDTCGSIVSYIFNDRSISTGALSYYWDFNLDAPGSMTSTFKNPPAQIYPDTGYYYISLTVFNQDSCSDTYFDSLYVQPKSRVNFLPLNPEGCEGDSIYFQDSTIYRSGNRNNVLTYLWDFGDGNTSTLKNPAHAYAAAGIYTVKLKVWDPSCVDSISKQVVIYNTPEAVILDENYELCAYDVVTLYSLTVDSFPNGDVVDSLIWYVSNGAQYKVYKDSSLSLSFNGGGDFKIGLVAITDKGCRDTADAQITVRVHTTPIVTFTDTMLNARTFRFDGLVDSTKNANYYWDFGDGNFNEGLRLDTISHRYEDRLCRIDEDIEKTVILTVANEVEGFGACLDADTLNVSMQGYHLNVPNAFAPDRLNVDDANVFLPKGRLLGSYRLRIFDEWGNVVFETSALDENGVPLEPWNGILNGVKMPMGAYVWTIDAAFNDGYEWPVQECNFDNIRAYGTVTLIR